MLSGTRYFYKCVYVGKTVSSATNSFVVPPVDGSRPLRIGVLGDWGSTGGATTKNDLLNNMSLDLLLHNGDFAYNLDSNNAKTGDEFMNNMQSIMASIPYMVPNFILISLSVVTFKKKTFMN